ncbi:4Fe4S-binding leucine-rich repeat protein [Bradyrhizobium arachidis]|uniref:4Fe4S-binding leucine-rich repeat protein n=1 Tax=Bradyrhizobium arachidis TaxID=858423 RepID=UPI002161CAD2|nr:4Fe4S-binding leucine-rich repeat protein [Bradyrhizobium arachidis]UVO30615.1 hypothetical protein KUF59_08120 [Bradyrhizobium arachidis]
MTDDIDEARDWLGSQVHCARSVHVGLKHVSRCQPKHACVNERCARRIDRFFAPRQRLAYPAQGCEPDRALRPYRPCR